MAEANTPEELKKKFAEALGAKKSRNEPSNASDKGSGNTQHSHGPVDPKRVFRRKSG